MLSNSYRNNFKLIETITFNKYQRPRKRATFATGTKRPIELHEVIKTSTFTAQVAQIHSLMKALMTPHDISDAKLINVAIKVG